MTGQMLTMARRQIAFPGILAQSTSAGHHAPYTAQNQRQHKN